MEVAEHRDELRVQGARLLQAAASSSLDAAVPTCPAWALRDLVRHLGGVHRWATEIVARPRTEPWDVDLEELVGTWPTDDELLEWFRQGHSALVAALTQADPTVACWTFLSAPSPLAMWARRQAHETAIHRVDAELAEGGIITPLSARFADDGIDELLTGFITRPGQRLRFRQETATGTERMLLMPKLICGIGARSALRLRLRSFRGTGAPPVIFKTETQARRPCHE